MDLNSLIHTPIFKYVALAVAILGTIAWLGTRVLVSRLDGGRKGFSLSMDINLYDMLFILLIFGLWKLYLIL